MDYEPEVEAQGINDDGVITLIHETSEEKREAISLFSGDESLASETAEKDENNTRNNIDDENESNGSKCLSADSLDSVKSGESVFKLFTFDPNKCTKNVEKCLAFWKKIDELDLKPVECSLYKPKTEKPASGEKREQIFENETNAEDTNDVIDDEKCKQNDADKEETITEEIEVLWCEALKELKKRNLDKTAKLAKPLRCKMCEAVTFEMEEEQQDNYAEIVALNDWKPGKIKKVGKHFLQKDGSSKEDISNIEGKTNMEQETLDQQSVTTERSEDTNKESTRTKSDSKIQQAGAHEIITETIYEQTPELNIERSDVLKTEESKESCLNLMEHVLKDVLSKMSEELDNRFDIKDLVNEIITTATEKLKNKTETENYPNKSEEIMYKIPPYSNKGDYPCDCDEMDCMCETEQLKSSVEVLKSPKIERKFELKPSKKSSTGTQCPEELEKVENSSNGAFCLICGLNNCICEYIQKSEANEAFIGNSEC